MSLYLNSYATCGLVLIITLLFLKYCRNILKLYEGYPMFHIVPYIVYCSVFRKVPKNMLLASFAFKLLTEKCMQHMKEGFCMIYTTGPILLIFGEEPVKMFSKGKSATTKPAAVYHIFQDFLGPGLVTNNGEKWKKHRKMINPAFSLGMLKDKVPLFNEHALAFVKDVEKVVGNPSVDLLGVIKCHYLNALLEAVFGLKQSEENKADIQKYLHGVENLCVWTAYRYGCPWLNWKFMLRTVPSGREYLRAYEDVFSFTKNILLKRKQQITSNQTSNPDSLDNSLSKSFTYILFQNHFNDPNFTFEDLHGEMNTFMFAGYDTVSYTTLWSLFMLGLYPEVQEKAYNEVQFCSITKYISYEDCSSFTYLESVILETLRLYPTVPLFVRQLTEDVQCGERKIPKGTMIGFFPYVMHRNPDEFPDPENFDPERFLGSKNNNSWAYMPFSEGYRNCIGKRYALIKLKIFLAYFLRNFKITSLDKREDIEITWQLILSPAKPLRMHIERR